MVDKATGYASRFRWLILLAITLLGAFFRLYQINMLPPGDGFDAAQYGLDALQILDGARPIFLAANFGREALFSYLVALVYLFIGPGILGIHVSSALIGIATIPGIYLAARALLSDESEIVRTWAPLLAAFVTAVSYWHLNYSRAGLRVIWVPFFGALITATLFYGLRRNSRPLLIATGLLLGLSQYTYQAARLLPVLTLAGFLLWYLQQRSFSRRDLVDMALTFGAALLVFLPLGVFAVQYPEVFNDRLRQTALLSQRSELREQALAVGGQTWRTLLMFFVEGDKEPLYTIPGRPSLNPFLAIFFVVGVGFSLWRWKRPSFLYLLAWLLLLVTPAFVADQAATAKRALGAFPAVAILIALGLSLPYAMLRRRGEERHWAAALFAALTISGLIWTGFVTYQDYFVRWGQDPALAFHYQRDHTELGLAAESVPQQESVLISPFSADHPSIQLNSNRHPNLRSYDGHRCLLLPNTAENGATYLIVPGETETSLDQLRQIFPQGQVWTGPQRPDGEGVYFTGFHVPAGSVPQAPGEEPLLTWSDAVSLIDQSVEPRQATPGDTISITLTYKAMSDLDRDYTAYIHLLGQPDPDGGSPIWGQADAEPCGGALRTSTWRTGDIVRDTIQVPVNPEAPPGTYRLVTGFYTWPDIAPLALNGQDQALITTVEIR